MEEKKRKPAASNSGKAGGKAKKAGKRSRYFVVEKFGSASNYWRHVREKHGDLGVAVEKRYKEFKTSRKVQTALPAGPAVYPANFRPRVTFIAQPTNRSAPLNHQLSVSGVFDAYKSAAKKKADESAPKKKALPPSRGPRLTVPAGFKPGKVKDSSDASAASAPRDV